MRVGDVVGGLDVVVREDMMVWKDVMGGREKWW